MGYEKQWPVGTNLFSAEQARNMLEYVVTPTLRYERLLLNNAEKEIAELSAPQSEQTHVRVPVAQMLHGAENYSCPSCGRNYTAPQQEPVAGRCVAPPCKCNDENRRKCAYWHEAPQPDGVGVPRETLKVYKSAPNYRDYLTARFRDRLDVSFEWNGKRYRYLHTDFDDTGDFDVLLAAAKEQQK